MLVLALVLPPLHPCPAGEGTLGSSMGSAGGSPDPEALPHGVEFGSEPQDSLSPSTLHLSSSLCPKAPNTSCNLKPKTSNERFSREIAAAPDDAGSASPSRTSAACL